MASDDGRVGRRPRRPGTFLYVLAVIAVLVAGVGLFSRDRVPINHLDATQAYFDRRDVLNQKFNDYLAVRVRRYSQKEKLRLSVWNCTAAHRYTFMSSS